MSELFLIAEVAGRRVAIEAGQVDSVVDIGAIVAVPCAAESIRGLAALRSRVVTVVDTQVALGQQPIAQPSRAVIARLDGHHYAFLVDALEDVAPFERASMTGGEGGGWSAAAAGVVTLNGEPLLVVDLAALVPIPVSAAA